MRPPVYYIESSSEEEVGEDEQPCSPPGLSGSDWEQDWNSDSSTEYGQPLEREEPEPEPQVEDPPKRQRYN